MTDETTEIDPELPPERAEERVSTTLLAEVQDFFMICNARYKFNSRWDNFMNMIGILLGVGIVFAGVMERSKVSAILGAFVSAVVTAQRAFPFGQRAHFYRTLLARAENLRTQLKEGLVTKNVAVETLGALRQEYAQQFPQGGTFRAAEGASASS